ncbi:S9 family peptidase [Phenylobacterium sp.]|jgi:dipeptidyl aminopeptidase/acylaminoacyl peptidase|uniref:alpha/beta hydrolase family protein n=1 Tax=Phenylobacterium sp. TaxID=1871053 RepID=UPI002F94324D
MTARALIAGLFALLALVTPAAAAPLEAYGGLPSIESIEVSPDGSTLAVAMTTGEQRAVAVKALPDGQMQTFSAGTAKVRRLDWVGGDNLIITTSQTGTIAGVTSSRGEHFLAFKLNLANRKVQPLLQGSIGGGETGTHVRSKNTGIGYSLNVLAGLPEVRTVDGAPTLFLRGVTFPSNEGVLTIFQMSPKHSLPKVVELGDPDTDDFVLGPDGTPLAKSDYNADNGRWTLKMRQAGGGWRISRTLEAKIDRPYLVGVGRDGRSVVVAEPGDSALVLREVAADGTWSEPLDVKDADDLVFDPESHRLIGLYALVGDEDRYTFFDPADQKAWNAVRAAFKGDRVLLESWSQDRKKIVVLVDSPIEGPAYALVDLTTKQASYLGRRYQKLDGDDISPVQAIRFKAKDGLELSGYLTVPRGAQAKNLPLVVFPHGGPASRDQPGFDWWAQAMASRGYAVLQVNFRGSDGFGVPFLEAGYGEWGRKMQTDLSDGVRFLAAQGTIDPKRVCIVGASYGGYAALAGAALDQGVYRCAASVAGVSDLRRMLAWSRDRKGEVAFRYWKRFMGAEAKRDPALTEASPAAHASRITIPVLLVHGRDDTVVPLEQSRIMAEALEKAGKPVELVVQKGADHWLSQGDTRIAMLQATIAFLEKHNPPN